MRLSFRCWIYQFNDAFENQDGTTLASLFSKKMDPTPPLINIRSAIFESISEVDEAWVYFIEAMKSSEISKDISLSTFRLFTDQLLKESWHLPILYLIAKQLTYQSIDSNEMRTAERAADCLMHAFRCCIRRRQWPIPLPLANCLFRLYNKMGRLILCKPLLRAFAQKSSIYKNSEDALTRGDKLSFLYYSGKCNSLVFHDENQALVDLEQVFYQSPREGCKRQKRAVLQWLIPLKIIRLGVFPKERLLVKYDIESCYKDMILSIRRGQPYAFDCTLEDNITMLLKRRTFMLWQSCRCVAVRNMFKRIILAMQKEIKDNKICIKQLVSIISICSDEDSFDEDYCILLLCQLIGDGYIRGYLSEKHYKLVLSKENPFPRFQDIMNK